jgi:hypothetical protein
LLSATRTLMYPHVIAIRQPERRGRRPQAGLRGIENAIDARVRRHLTPVVGCNSDWGDSTRVSLEFSASIHKNAHLIDVYDVFRDSLRRGKHKRVGNEDVVKDGGGTSG